MGSYREVNELSESFYIDSFVSSQQIEITQVIRSIGGAVEYDRQAYHVAQYRARYKVTLPAGCVYEGLDVRLAPQMITLPGGKQMRQLCVYPQEDRVELGWLPGDSADPALWDRASRRA